MKQKSDIKLRSTLRDMQLDKEALLQEADSPVDFYNKYIRKEGEPVLTKEQYEKVVKQRDELASKKRSAMYPLVPSNSIQSKPKDDATHRD